jgi:hypothetical protein
MSVKKLNWQHFFLGGGGQSPRPVLTPVHGMEYCMGIIKAINHWRKLAWPRFEPGSPKWHTGTLSTTLRAHAQLATFLYIGRVCLFWSPLEIFWLTKSQEQKWRRHCSSSSPCTYIVNTGWPLLFCAVAFKGKKHSLHFMTLFGMTVCDQGHNALVPMNNVKIIHQKAFHAHMYEVKSKCTSLDSCCKKLDHWCINAPSSVDF